MKAMQRTEIFINEIYEYAFSAVPPGKKKSTGKLLLIMTGVTFSTSGLTLGAKLGRAMVFPKAMAACLLGNLMLYALALLWGMMGYESGCTSVCLVKKILGDKAGMFYSALIVAAMILWVGVNGDLLAKMVVSIFPWWGLPLPVTVLLMVAICVACVIGGWKSLENTAKFSVPVIALMTCYNILKLAGKTGGFAYLKQFQPGNIIDFIPAVVMIFGNFFLFAVTIPNLCRFARSRRAVIFCITSSVGALLASNLCGILIAQATMANNLNYGIYLLGMVGQNFVWMTLCTYTTQSVNMYTGSLAVQNFVRGTVMGGNISHSMAVLFIGGLSAIVGVLGFARYLDIFIGGILLLVMPCAVIMVLEIFMRRNRERVAEWKPLAVWFAGIVFGLSLCILCGTMAAFLQIPAVALWYAVLRGHDSVNCKL